MIVGCRSVGCRLLFSLSVTKVLSLTTGKSLTFFTVYGNYSYASRDIPFTPLALCQIKIHVTLLSIPVVYSSFGITQKMVRRA